MSKNKNYVCASVLQREIYQKVASTLMIKDLENMQDEKVNKLVEELMFRLVELHGELENINPYECGIKKRRFKYVALLDTGNIHEGIVELVYDSTKYIGQSLLYETNRLKNEVKNKIKERYGDAVQLPCIKVYVINDLYESEDMFEYNITYDLPPYEKNFNESNENIMELILNKNDNREERLNKRFKELQHKVPFSSLGSLIALEGDEVEIWEYYGRPYSANDKRNSKKCIDNGIVENIELSDNLSYHGSASYEPIYIVRGKKDMYTVTGNEDLLSNVECTHRYAKSMKGLYSGKND